ncbi:unnamed protein product [Lactuca saligna]|uniref:Uncharacterized protein n=1 Tax=Lactuca saligna TaxID=75948 RepID=A0AA36EMJ2_LACSI|nr:unnamed protein product [Lactuca saligna]
MEGETEAKENDGEINENENDEEKNDKETEETNDDVETSRKNETNQNMLDKVVENIVDNILGIKFSNLNSQEDEIWNDNEMKIILDNIDTERPPSHGPHRLRLWKKQPALADGSNGGNGVGWTRWSCLIGTMRKNGQLEDGGIRWWFFDSYSGGGGGGEGE